MIRSDEEFRASDKRGDCCQIPQWKEGYRFLRRRSLVGVAVSGGGLCTLGFSLEMRIWHNAPTFNAAYFPRPQFLFRHTVRDHATMGTGARGAHGDELRVSF